MKWVTCEKIKGDRVAAGEGLRYVASGFGAFGLSDNEILDREFVVYDAL